jgi:predicted ATPase
MPGRCTDRDAGTDAQAAGRRRLQPTAACGLTVRDSGRVDAVSDDTEAKAAGGAEPAAATAPDTAGRVFISYASHDADVAARLCSALEAAGLSCWIAPRNVRGGESYAAAIVQAINGCRMLLLVLSRSAIASSHVLREVERASSKNRTVLAIRMDDAGLPPELEYFLSANHWIDATGGTVDEVLPTIIESVRGAGYRGAGTLDSFDSLAPSPRARFAPPPAARVPRRLDDIIGRDAELAQIAALLATHRAVTLLGAGGIGKTECALEFARLESGRYPDGVWFSDLAPMAKAADWLESLALSLSIAPGETPVLIEKVASLLFDRKALLMLDNCDRLSAEVGAIIVELLRRTERLQVLATSQRQLEFVGERVLRIPPLAFPSAAALHAADGLTEVAQAPAIRLLTARISAVHPAFELNARNAATLIEICRTLDGMPLALELAASRFAMLSAEQVLERLKDRFKFLVGDVAGRDLRHQTLSALLEWSYALLSADEQRLLCWLSVFLKGWSADVADNLAPSLALDADRVGELLTGLVKKSFVAVDLVAATPRYRLLESIRDFALGKLAAQGAEAAARDAHLACMRTLSRASHEAMLSQQCRECVARLNAERANIGGALEWARRSGNHEASLEIIGSLLLYVRSHGALEAGGDWAAHALAHTADAPSRMRARVLLTLGILGVHRRTSEAETARLLAQALEVARETGDDWALGCAAAYRAMQLADSGKCDAAVELVIKARAVADTLGDDWLRGIAGLAQGWIDLGSGNLRGALSALQAVRHLSHDLHQRHFVDMYIGLSLFRLGDLRLAAAAWYISLRNAIQIEQERGMTGSIEGCAYLCAQLGHAEQALRLMSVAALSRDRKGGPLFSFWLPHHQSTLETLAAALGPGVYRRLGALGETIRYEDAVNEALDTLGRFAAKR